MSYIPDKNKIFLMLSILDKILADKPRKRFLSYTEHQRPRSAWASVQSDQDISKWTANVQIIPCECPGRSGPLLSALFYVLRAHFSLLPLVTDDWKDFV